MLNITVNEYCDRFTPGILEKLNLCVKIAVKLEDLQKKNILQGRFRPDFILIDEESLEVMFKPMPGKIDGTGTGIKSAHFSELNLRYLSPEATGRINASVDYRSDFYSLGAVLYEIFAGTPPFTDTEPADLLHAHLARNPIPLNKKNPGIPAAVSGIVLKLLEKNPDDRYQTSAGIIHDLKRCINQLNSVGAIDQFTPGTHDTPAVFRIPEKVYGRHKEILIMNEYFSEVQKEQSRFLFISGPPGIGKSFLVHEVMHTLKKDNSYFISGKFEQYSSAIPCLAFVQAFQSLIHQLLSENSESLSKWRNKIQSAVGRNGKILTDLLPDLIHIIGPQAVVDEVTAQEAQNRFKFVLHSFIQIFANTGYSLIIFIDDLQWADKASFELMDLIYSDSSLYVFFISAYRNIEILENIHFTNFLSSVEKNNYHAGTIEMNPVGAEYVSAMLEDIFHHEMIDNSRLIELVLQKTNGNPLFIKEILLQLHRLGHIYLQADDKGELNWFYNTEDIGKVSLPETLADILTGRINKLPQETREILQVASCIGVPFTAELIREVSPGSDGKISSVLDECVNENLLSVKDSKYIFSHDKVQEAVYCLISDENLKSLHHRIGIHMLQKHENDEEYIFEITNHLNLSAGLSQPDNEKEKLSRLNYLAAVKAKKTNAYDSMISFLKNGLSHLNSRSWETQYEITLSLYIELMECESINKNFAESDKAFAELIQNVKSDISKAEIYALRVRLLNDSSRYREAIDHARQGLKILGNNLFNYKSSIITLLVELIKFKIHYINRGIEDILQYPPAEDIKENIAAKIFVNLAPALSIEDTISSLILLFRIHNNYLKKKNLIIEDMPLNFMGIALAVCTALNDYPLACRFGELALHTAEKYNNPGRSRIVFLFAFSINHWKRHARYSLDYYNQAYNISFSSGDFYSAANSIHSTTSTKYILGHNLHEIKKYCDQHKQVLARIFLKDNINILIYDIAIRLILKLMYDDGEHAIKTGVDDDYVTGNSDMAIFFILVSQLKVQYLFEQYDHIPQNIPFLSKNEKTAMSALILPEFNFYYSLSLAALWGTADKSTRRKYRSILKKNQKKMKTWALNSPENFLHKYLLVQAETARVTGKDQKDETGSRQKAERLYDLAIRSAHEQEYINNEAIANECTAKYYLQAEMDDRAKQYVLEAFRLYREWGAEAKCRQLKEKYPEFLIHEDSGITAPSTDYAGHEIETSRNILMREIDLKTMQAVSAGMSNLAEVESAIKNSLRILCKGTGAKRAALLFFEGNEVTLHASIETSDGNEDIFNIRKGENENQEIPLSIIQYVKNTGVTINLESKTNPRFSDDRFIKKFRIKSALCKSLLKLKQKEIIVYIENNSLPELFNEARMPLVNTIFSQITTVLENILLKEMLQDKNETKQKTESIPVEVILQEKYLLTQQEAKISLMLMDGMSREDVCDELAISYKTLKNHLYSMYSKTINLDEDDFAATGRIDKLSRFLLFLMNLEKKQ